MIGLSTEDWQAIGLTVKLATTVTLLLLVISTPIQNAMQAIGQRPLELAATLGASPIDRFFNVVLPLSKPGFISASVLGFAHTVGEFGVILMIGGNIPGQTRVVSIQIYDHVEALQYQQAHWLAGSMLAFSFVVLLVLYYSQYKKAGANMRFGL